jgi:hypothetical protein
VTSEEAEEARYRDPATAYQFLLNAMLQQPAVYGEKFRLLPMLGLVDVIRVDFKRYHRRRVFELCARAVRIDGRLDILEYAEDSVSPSPSDADCGYFDFGVHWQNLDDNGAPIKWCHLYSAVGPLKELNPKTTNARTNKMLTLYRVLKEHVRIRIVDDELSFNDEQRHEMYQQLGRVLVNLSEKDPIWSSAVLDV